MILLELFSESLVDTLRQAVVEILTPLVANKVPFVTIQSMIDSLKERKPGVMIDRAMIMSIVDPKVIKNVTKINGDRIYLQSPDEDTVAASKDQEQENKDRVENTAIKQAKKSIQK